MKHFKIKSTQKLKILNKGVLIIAGTSLVGLITILIILFYHTNPESGRAEELPLPEELIKDPINNGEILLYFDWEKLPVTKPIIGPIAIGCSMDAFSDIGGNNHTRGLNAGRNKKDINMVLIPAEIFNQNGIDIAMDFKRTEESGSFFTRGSYFNFGFKKGMITIAYKLENETAQYDYVNETTDYEIPMDDDFRNYRFIFSPVTGRAEIFADQIVIWSHQHINGMKLFWNKDDRIMIAYQINGGGSKKTILDNLVIRTAGKNNKFEVNLLSFTADVDKDAVRINWITSTENNELTFIIERSFDTRLYEEIGKLKAIGKSDTPIVYEIMDRNPVERTVYYRLKTSKTTGANKLPVIAFRYKKTDQQLQSELLNKK